MEPRGLVIAPILVEYFYRSHDFGSMDPLDIIRLCLLGIDIHRIRLEQSRYISEAGERYFQLARCTVDALDITMNTITSSTCGHVYCRRCYGRLVCTTNVCAV